MLRLLGTASASPASLPLLLSPRLAVGGRRACRVHTPPKPWSLARGGSCRSDLAPPARTHACRGSQSWTVHCRSRRLGGGGCVRSGSAAAGLYVFRPPPAPLHPHPLALWADVSLASTLGVLLNSFAETLVFCTPMLLEHRFSGHLSLLINI